MSKVERDPIAVKKKVNGAYPWDSTPLPKDIAHDGFLTQGHDFGVGHRQPVGTEKCSPMESGPIPQKSMCFSPKVIFQNDKKS